MNLITVDCLTERHKSKINGLLDECARFESIAVFYPEAESNDTLRHYLLFTQEEELISILAVSPSTEYSQELECRAFTRPDMRRQGYFSLLLDTCIEEFPETALLFPVNHHSNDALCTMLALDAEDVGTEYRMERAIAEEQADTASDQYSHLILKKSGLDTWSLSTKDQVHLGLCKTAASGTGLCLHHVEIVPAYRSQGYASAMLTMLFPRLAAAGCTSVFLHVSGNNTAAVALYKKTGFLITETLSYYLY